MLAIRMQRTGRKGHAMYRVVVQESRLTPTSGRVVAQLGHYDPHAKTVVIDKEKAATYLSNGAQPSERVAAMLKKEGVKLPDWVVTADKKTKTTKNAEKLRKNQPKEEKVEEPAAEEPAEEVSAEEPATEESTDTEAATEEETKE